ncbi:MAG: membrane protein insertase YidC, partial [Desulfobulbaceae bacterium]|nr:membrane protein insertase YidC [Candidatus Desulfatifera sulfidica]
MDIYRALLAIVISFLILIGYQYFFVGFAPVEVAEQPVAQVADAPVFPASTKTLTSPTEFPAQGQTVRPDREARNITVETDLYQAVISEDGGTLRSFVLSDFREESGEDSPGMQFVRTEANQGFPLAFTWGSVAGSDMFYSVPEGVSNLAGDSRLSMT